MSKFNKTISTTIVEQVKSAVIITLIALAAGVYVGIQYQKTNTPVVNNSVVVQSDGSVNSVKK